MDESVETCFLQLHNKISSIQFALNVATLLLEEWEDDTHTPEMGTWESIRTPKTSKFNCKGQNTLH